MDFGQQIIPALPLAMTYSALPDDAMIPNPYHLLQTPLPIESSDQPSAAEAEVSENGSPVPQKIFTDPASVAIWQQRLGSLTPEQRALLLNHSQGEVRELTAFVERQCTAHRLQSHATKINNFLKPIFRTVGQIMPAITAASNADPYPSSIVVGGVVALMQISNNFNLYQSEIAKWLSKFGERAEILMEYDVCVFQCDPKVQKALANVFGDFLDFCQKVLKIYYKETGEPRSGAVIMGQSMFKNFADKFGSITDSFENHLEIYKEAALQSNTQDIQRSLLHLQDLTRMTKDVMRATERNRRELWASQHWQLQFEQQQFRHLNQTNQTILNSHGKIHAFEGETRERQLMKDSQKREEERLQTRKLILEWLREVDFVEVKDDRRASLLKDSGRWILQHERYTNWENALSSDLLWVTGKPGTGKSVLSTVVCDELNIQRNTRSSVAVIDFLCSSTVLERSDYKKLLIHTLSQAVLQCPQLPKEAKSLFDKDGFRGRDSSVKDLEETLTQTFSYFDAVYLILDGVDELQESKRLLLLKFLTSLLSNSKAIVKAIIFSRDYVKSQSTLEKYPSLQVEDANKADINTFISEKIGELSPVWQDGMVNIVTTMLSKSADGTYLYVNLMISALAGDMTTSQIIEKLDELPEGLDKAYEANLVRVMKQAASNADKLLVCRILFWLSNARRPLTPAELLEALSIRVGASSIRDSDRYRTDRNFTERCGELIKLQQDGNYHLAHDSLRDYLLNMGDEIPEELQMYHELQSQAGDTIGNTCLTYLLLLPCNESHFESREELNAFQKSHPLFNYATKFWGEHLAEGSIMSSQNDLAWNFLRSENLFNLSAQLLLDDGLVLAVPKSFTKLHMISYFGLCDFAKQLSRLKKVEIAVDGFGCTPLDYALSKSRKDMSMWLVESDEELPSRRGALQYSALHGAVKMKAVDLLKLCIAKDFDVNQRAGEARRTALMVAAVDGFEEATRLLLETNADADLVDKLGKNALMCALESECIDVAKILLSHTKSPSIQDSEGLTALHAAARIGALEVVRELLNRNCPLLPAKESSWSLTPLHEAIQSDHLEVMQELYRHDLDQELTSKGGYRPMHLAASENSLRVARYVARIGWERNPRLPGGKTALHIAAEQGHNDFIEFLLEEPLDLNMVDDEKNTSLHFAAENGHESTCQMLLERKAQIDPLNEGNHTPLYLSMTDGNLKVAKLLLSHKANPMIPGVLKSPALHYAAYYGQKELIRDLLANGSNPEAENEDKQTALHFAAEQGKLEFLVELFAAVAEGPISRQLEASISDGKSSSPIHKVLLKQTSAIPENIQLKIIKLLEEHGCQIGAKNSDGNLAIHLAAWDGHREIFEHLFRKEILNTHGYFHRTLLCTSVLKGHREIMEYLLRRDADTEIGDEDGCTPLMIAVSQDKVDWVSTLLEHHADPKTCSNDKWNLLHRASRNGNIDLVKRFIELRCDIRARTAFGETPFHFAVESNDLDLVEYYLREVHVDVNESDRSGSRPVHAAAAAGNLAMFTRLLKAGADPKAKNLVGQDAMIFAVKNGRHWLIRPLIQLGLPVNPEAPIDTTPLIGACEVGCIRCVEALLENEANVNHAMQFNGIAALHCAVNLKQPKIVRALLRHGADIDQKNKYGFPPWKYVGDYKPHFEATGELSDVKRTTPQDIGMESVWNFLRTSLEALVALPTTNEVEVMIPRLYRSCNVLEALTISKDKSFQPQLKTLHMRLGFSIEEDSFSPQRQCYFCWRAVSNASFWACLECIDRYICSQCHSNIQEGSNGLKKPPEGFTKLMEIERSVRAFRFAMLHKIRLFSLLMVLGQIVGVSALLKDFIDKKHGEYKEWDEVHRSYQYSLQRRPGQQLIKLLHEGKEILGKPRNVDELKSLWEAFEKKSLDIRRLCDIDIDELDELSLCRHDNYEMTKKDTQEARKDRAIFEENGNLTTQWWNDLLNACLNRETKTQTADKIVDFGPSDEGKIDAPGSSKSEKTLASITEVINSRIISSTLQNVPAEESAGSAEVRDLGLQMRQTQMLGKDLVSYGGLGSKETDEFKKLKTQGEVIQSAKESGSSQSTLESKDTETTAVRRSSTREFTFLKIGPEKKLGRQDSLPLRPLDKPAVVRRSTAPFSAHYTKSALMGLAETPYEVFDVVLVPDSEKKDDATPDDETKGNEDSEEKRATPSDKSGIISGLGDDSATQDGSGIKGEVTSSEVKGHPDISEDTPISKVGGLSAEPEESNGLGDDSATQDGSSIKGEATSSEVKGHPDISEDTPISNVSGLSAEPEESDPPTASNSEEKTTNVKSAQPPQTEKILATKIIVGLGYTSKYGFFVLEAMEVGESIREGHTRDFIAMLMSEGDAADYGLELMMRTIQVEVEVGKET